MRDPARLQAAIEILDRILAAARDNGAAADTIIQRHFAARRYAGSKDRAAVRDLVYAAIRLFADPPPSGRAAMLGLARHARPDLVPLFDGSTHAPAPLSPDEPAALPSPAPHWLIPHLLSRFGDDWPLHAAALIARAPLDLRVNRLKTGSEAVRAALPDAHPVLDLPDALRLEIPLPLDSHPLMQAGHIEVQDAGSQHVVRIAAPRPGQTVIDLCAGAGGKTLALAAAMANQGRIIASDTDRGRLSALPQRRARAGAGIVETRLLNPRREREALADLAGSADRVLVDAPCSGTGTWRRNPEARWRLTRAGLATLVAEQDRLLALAAELVRPGGTLTYVVCSLLPVEGEARIEAFLARSPGFAATAFAIPTQPAPVTHTTLSPGVEGCDGFFIAQLRRLC